MTKVYKLYTELLDYKPTIWRRFFVADSMKLSNLAYALMGLYHMEGNHLFNFLSPANKTYYGLKEEEELADIIEINAKATPLRKVMTAVGHQIIFNYDFGDSWAIFVGIEEVTESEFHPQKYPILIGGEGYGIIEDCGGTPGLEDIAKAFKRKKGQKYEDYCEWLGRRDLDLETFNGKYFDFRYMISYFRSIYENTEPPARYVWVKNEED